MRESKITKRQKNVMMAAFNYISNYLFFIKSRLSKLMAFKFAE